MDGVGMDYVSDSYSMEILGVVIAERVWAKWHKYTEDKSNDKRMDKMAEDIARLKGKLDK